jgi:hypothetical protein
VPQIRQFLEVVDEKIFTRGPHVPPRCRPWS